MTVNDPVPTNGVTDDPIRLGTLLYTLVEPHRGHEVEYNRWYERDHFYAGCQIGAFNFSGGRFVATAGLKARRTGGPTGAGAGTALIDDRAMGSYLSLYYVLEGHHAEWNRWAVDQVNTLHAAGRMFEHRDHVHTGLYRFAFEHRRDADGVPAELTLDHRFEGLVSMFVEPAPGRTVEELAAWYQEEVLSKLERGTPVATVLGFTPLPLLADAPGDVPREESPAERLLLLCFLDGAPGPTWDEHFSDHERELEGQGTLLWASPFVATVPGTDRYTDELWGDGA